MSDAEFVARIGIADQVSDVLFVVWSSALRRNEFETCTLLERAMDATRIALLGAEGE